MACEISITLDPATQSGLTLVVRLYLAGVLAATLPLAESPVGSAVYSNAADIVGLAAGTYVASFDVGTTPVGTGELRWTGSAEATVPGGDGPPPAGSYLSVGVASTLAATLPPTLLAAYLAAGEDGQASALLMASGDVDSAMRYQGRRLKPDQVNEFPRLPYPEPSIPGHRFGLDGDWEDNRVWDLDPATHQPVVPPRVLQAVLFQADYLLRPNNGRLDVQHEGLGAKSTGGVREEYGGGPGVRSGLCRRAEQLVAFYALRTGRLI